LQQVGDRLKSCVREEDTVARLGGDEFVVLAVDALQESAEAINDRIQATLELRNQLGRRPYQLGLSMGIARCNPAVPCTVSELIVEADARMYSQKQASKAQH